MVPDRNRKLYLIAIVAACIGIGFGFFLGRIDVRDADIHIQHQNERAQQVSKYSYGFFPPWPFVGAPVGDEKTYSGREKTDQRELAAQEWMAWLSFWMLIVTAFGVYFVAKTLKATHKTLAEAKSATSAALHGANAAWETNKTTRELGIAQARAYVSIERCHLEVDEDRQQVVVRINLKNSGQSPALFQTFEVHAQVHLHSHGTSDPNHTEILVLDETISSDIAANSDFTFEFRGHDWFLLHFLDGSSERLYPTGPSGQYELLHEAVVRFQFRFLDVFDLSISAAEECFCRLPMVCNEQRLFEMKFPKPAKVSHQKYVAQRN